ncbi:unnamed protein product [Dracunculus medinensis]|uniref:Zinc finger, C2H2 type n=1 Tax=Dracunculus medinensis TaxID=318479 RepID=A0A0N4U611_DRAME|nr:unnamed protein product [Dracunculus medinensis]
MEECRLLRMHECQQCGKRFKARGGLQQHIRIHSNDRPYQCRFCPKRFTQKSHVDQHERIHTGSKPFSCQICGRAFRQRSQQLGHEATHANSGVLSVAANIAASQQVQINNDKSPIDQSNGHSPKTPEQLLNGDHRAQLTNLVNNNAAGGMFAHTAVTSLLALSQGIHLQ